MKRLLSIAVVAAAIAAPAAAKEVLPFVEDNFTKAVAQAKTKNVPIFVEAWAPW